MISQKPAISPGGSICRKSKLMRKASIQVFLLFLVVAALPFLAYAEPTYPISEDVRTTRQRTVHPASITDTPPYLKIYQVARYGTRGYSSWRFGRGVDAGPLLPDGSPVGSYASGERLLTFFSMSDIHIVDKESPAQAIYSAKMPGTGFGETNTSAYSPIMMSTTHVLDAAVQTINALHRHTPFDFGISLGDAANNNQYNELRWYIDVIDGKWIIPSSGAHRGAHSIDYQKPYQSAGLDKSISWYQVIGNHDQFWCGTLPYNNRVRNVLIGDKVLDMGFVGPSNFPSFDASGFYMGVLDGATQYGKIIYAGPVGSIDDPIITADKNRHALSTSVSTSRRWMREFFNTTSKPQGHGFKQTNLDNDFASYTFEPKASVPLKVIALDDTCKENPYATYGSYARACLDQERYRWLVRELDRGQAEGKLMIIAAHIPVGPQANVPEALQPPPPTLHYPLFLSSCTLEGTLTDCAPLPPYNVVSDEMLLSTLHNYPNLILWMSGHRHINTVTPQPAPAGKGPEFGFWEVETSSLRDFPQQFRTFEIVRNDNNTLSIFVTNVDPAVKGKSPAAKSRGYAIGANRIAIGVRGLTDTTSRAYNAELIKPLPDPYTLKVKVAGPGAVISKPYSGVNCAADSSCSATYLPGTRVRLVAKPAPGAAFTGWSKCPGRSACTIKMDGNVTVKANFTWIF
jgi:metallophosphoesterase (TIGR03768 family)